MLVKGDFIMNRLETSLALYQCHLNKKYEDTVENKWFWCVFAIVVLVAVAAYAFYCTSKGYNFTGKVKLHWPKIWEMGIGCSR